MDSRQGHPEPDSESPPVAASSPRSPKLKASSKLNRWSMARALRSGVKVIDRPINAPHRQSTTEESDRKTSAVDGDDVAAGKSIYLVSDGTGWTAEHSVNAALGQFEDRLVNRGCSVNTHLFSWVEDEEKLLEIINQAAKQKAMCFYTLANPSMSKSAKEACDQLGVLSVDILGPIIEGIASHLGVSPSGLTRGAPGRVKTLNDAYFKRIEAIEFTIKQDDGTLPENLGKADIILVGVSRTGKTPLSTYIAQKGYKVANVPFVMGVEPPKTLFEVEPRKVFALTIQLVVLQAIRRTRAKTLGVDTEGENRYSGFDLVRKELDFASKIYAKNPGWAVIVLLLAEANAQGLKVGFYSKTCPHAEGIVRKVVFAAMKKAPTLGAPLLRMFFHDCFVRGCDGSVLLDSSNNQAEKNAVPNLSLRGFGIIDDSKAALEKVCPGIVSCSDILALIARDAMVALEGPSWEVETGRRDGRVSNINEVNLPSPFDNIAKLITDFRTKGLNEKDLVILSGGHTIGMGHCPLMTNRLYNFTGRGDSDPSLDSEYAANLRKKCKPTDTTTALEMDPGSFKTFDVSYFKLVAKRRGLFQSDAALLDNSKTRAYILQQARGSTFFHDFGVSMVKMGRIGVLTGRTGEIRKMCRVPN